MKLLNSGKGLVFSATTVFAFAAILLLLFAGSGILKLLLTDKTPFLLGGALILLYLFKEKRREGRN